MRPSTELTPSWPPLVTLRSHSLLTQQTSLPLLLLVAQLWPPVLVRLRTWHPVVTWMSLTFLATPSSTRIRTLTTSSTRSRILTPKPTYRTGGALLLAYRPFRFTDREDYYDRKCLALG